MTAWHVWRHPKPQSVAGRCIGARSDVRVDPRKVKRLAHRIRQQARREGGASVVWTSPLQRSWAVGAWLRRWGWRHVVDARLAELDFGHWDGQPWHAIGAAAVDAWCADFAQHAPGGGESVAALLARCQAFVAERVGHGAVDGAGVADAARAQAVYAVGHAGWISAAQWLAVSPWQPPTAAQWPRAVGYGVRVDVAVGAAGSAPTLERALVRALVRAPEPYAS